MKFDNKLRAELSILFGLIIILFAGCGEVERSAAEFELPEERELIHPDLSSLSGAVAAVGEGLLQKTEGSDGVANTSVLAQNFGSLGLFYLAQEFYEAAQLCFDRSISIEPQAFKWWYLSGFALREQGESQLALSRFEAAHQRRKNYSAVSIAKAETELELGREEDAESSFEEILQSDDVNLQASVGLASIYLGSQRVGQAIDLLKRVLELNPNSKEVNHALASALRRDGQNVEAAKLLSQPGLFISFPSDSLLDLANLFKDESRVTLLNGDKFALAGYFSEAVVEYRKVIALDPYEPDAWNNLSVALSRLGKDQEALAVLEEGVEKNPKEIVLLTSLANLHSKLGNYPRSLALFEDLNSSYPDETGYLLNFGKTLLENEDFPRALVVFIRLKDEFGRGASVNYLIAKCLSMSGDYQDAAAHLEEQLDEIFLQPSHRLKYRMRFLSSELSRGEKQSLLAEIKILFDQARTPENTFLYTFSLAMSGRPLEASQILTSITTAYKKQYPQSDLSRWQDISDFYLSENIPTDVWSQYPFD